jgi:hypothetical protein
MTVIGEDTSERLDVIPAQCQWRREIPQNRRAEIPHFILI